MAERTPKPRKTPKRGTSRKRQKPQGEKKTNRFGESDYTEARIELFLKLIRRGKRITAACEEAEINRGFLYNLRSANADFAEAWDTERMAGFKERADTIEDTMFERAVEGYVEATSRGDKIVKAVRKFDNALLMRLAEAEMPKKYRRNVKIEGEVGPSDELSEMIERIQGDDGSGLKSLIKP